MNEQQQSINTLQDIKKMMERSSRFISLSGLSGIAAGIIGLIGSWLAYNYLSGNNHPVIQSNIHIAVTADQILQHKLFMIAIGTFIAALVGAFFFTWLKSKNDGVAIWGNSAKRLIINLSIPLLAGAIFLFHLIQLGNLGLIVPGCLIFYGLALINAAKFTLDDIRYLGYLQLLLGIICLWFPGYGLYFWAIGFGILHIIYGVLMWSKYERQNNRSITE